ncbi:MAG: HEAT repeat domain-containing protein [Isosphaeraceae bacterium]
MVPLDSVAEPAAAKIRDRAPEVRRQALAGFARRPAILTEEDILERLYDEDPAMQLRARTVLEQRGLTEDQIELGSQVFNPDPGFRKQVVAKLNGRDDIDPIVWLIHLSRDKDEAVRAEALKAMQGRAAAPEVVQRLTEMAVKDPSKSIRAEARKLLPAEAAALMPAIGDEVTVSVPPLPGSAALKPRAN